ncbi:hypothetical protein AKJ09_04225 [Labilithrix luteola]|uniref:Peptidase MA-like domain-containing protein n=2 Tax=Labilithrix luteola TaxID=1391654 RepID=A0A0K1PVZ6_9BACT|nr:hypothetical protein AKJ09_04225 [Labilithrix luteola]
MIRQEPSHAPRHSRSASSIGQKVMRRVRHWLSFLAAFVLAFGFRMTGVAQAQELAPLPGGSGGGGEATAPAKPSNGPALTLPRDVPVVLSAAQAHVPPLPAGYITKDLGWLRFSYPPQAAERVESLLRDAESVRAELADALGQNVLERIEIRVAPTVSDMARLAPPEAPPPDYADGVAYPRLRLILLSMLAPRGGEAVELERVFRHELAHLALEDAVLGQHVPTWFNEGLAMALSGESRYDRLRVLWNATISGTLLPLSEIDRNFPTDHFEVNIAYAQSADFMAFLMRQSDKARFAALIRRVREGSPFERAINDAYGSDVRKLEFQWRSDLERRYTMLPILTGGGIIWVAGIGALGAAYVRKRRRAKAILDRWEREEAIEDALRARALVEAKDETDGPASARAHLGLRALKKPEMAKIEHEGRWHTLH